MVKHVFVTHGFSVPNGSLLMLLAALGDQFSRDSYQLFSGGFQ